MCDVFNRSSANRLKDRSTIRVEDNQELNPAGSTVEWYCGSICKTVNLSENRHTLI